MPVPLLRGCRQHRPRAISWKRGRYDDAELANVYTGNDARAAIVLKHCATRFMNLGAMRALGFCVSVDHAEFMAQTFRRGRHPGAGGQRLDARRRARAGPCRICVIARVNVLFAVDLFNEGLDLPEVDTMLFLRPTESATVFLQQLGRGLRRARDKAVLTVLDFIGHHRKEFRFDLRLRALTGQTRRGLEREIERGFPFLPSGCQIVLDRQSQHDRAGQHPQPGREPLAADRRRAAVVRRPGSADLSHESGLELSDIASRQQLVDRAATGRGPADTLRAPTSRRHS